MYGPPSAGPPKPGNSYGPPPSPDIKPPGAPDGSGGESGNEEAKVSIVCFRPIIRLKYTS